MFSATPVERWTWMIAPADDATRRRMEAAPASNT
jgi:hypothetical protein